MPLTTVGLATWQHQDPGLFKEGFNCVALNGMFE